MDTFGWNNTTLTKKHRPRIRFTLVITSTRLPPGKPMEGDICICCGRCIKLCLTGALHEDNYPDAITAKTVCIGCRDYCAEGYIPSASALSCVLWGRDKGVSSNREVDSSYQAVRQA